VYLALAIAYGTTRALAAGRGLDDALFERCVTRCIGVDVDAGDRPRLFIPDRPEATIG
jgi:hypothetical protein